MKRNNIYSEQHKRDFKKWAESRKIQLLEKEPNGADFKIGEKVGIINGYGLYIEGFEIIGFCEPDITKGTIFLDWDCYWAAIDVKRVRKLEHQSKH